MTRTQIDITPFDKAKRAHVEGRVKEADLAYQAVLEADPNNAEAWHLIGVLRGQTGDFHNAVEFINKALALAPHNPTWLYNLGGVFQKANAVYPAIIAFTRVVALDDSHAKAWSNLGSLFLVTNNYEAALRAFESGILADPKFEALHDNLCRMHKRENDFAACLRSADRGLKSLPESARLWIHRAEAYFAIGNLEKGWEAYEWRFRAPENPNVAPDYQVETWQGQSLTGKSILIWTEQGPGETFLFSTMLQEIIDQSKDCTVATTERLLPILSRSFPDANIVDAATVDAASCAIDFQCSLISAGRWLRKSWRDFPLTQGHITADPNRRTDLSKRIRSDDDNRPIVGIAWRSFGAVTEQQKSIVLDALRPVLAVPDIKFVSLQYGDVRREIDDLKTTTGIEIHPGPIDNPISDLEGHLALVAEMELVISSSNTTVHAAAALGVPVWCAVPHTLGEGLRWPWFVSRKDSPWYASTRLYRQDIIADWTMPIARMAVDLAKWRASRDAAFDISSHLLSVALAYRKAKQPEAYTLAAEAALQENPSLALAARIAAQGCTEIGQYERAIEHIDPLLDAEPDNIKLLIDRATPLQKLDRMQEAEADLVKALALDPNNFEGLHNLGNLKAITGFSREALELHTRASSLDPTNKSLTLSVANRLSELGRVDESRVLMQEILKDADKNKEAASRFGLGLLSNGIMDEAWSYLRYRLSLPEANVRYDHFPFPAWSGESVAGKRVLVWTEQGIGEETLIATMMEDLSKQAESVTLLCTSRLLPLFRRSLPGIRVARRDEPLPGEAVDARIDIQMSFSDVGELLRPNLDSFPRSLKRPTLRASSTKRENLRKKYTEPPPHSALIGVSWHSSAPDFGPAKSIPPNAFARLIREVQAQFISLQYKPKPEHVSILEAAAPDRWLLDQTIDPMADMSDAAAQISALDFVVTISNTTAHLAGALGIPTALLVPPHAGRHWYWFKGQTTSSWYPSVELYEADRTLNWSIQLERVADRLKKQVTCQ